MFKVCTLTDLTNVNEVLSPAQKSDFSMNSVTLTVVLISTLITVFAVCVCFMIHELQTEAAKVAEQNRIAKARQLRYVKSKQEVKAGPIEEGEFHIFLSHVWSTGQE